MTREHYLPPRIGTLLKRLDVEYQRRETASLELRLIRSARALVKPETEYDNWNGGTYGHDVVMYLPLDVLALIPLDKQGAIEDLIAKDLNSCVSKVENEFFRHVRFEIANDADPDYQRAIAATSKLTMDPYHLSIWERDFVRLFISHRDTHKVIAHTLADALRGYGISSFVAHDTIEPTKEWRKEITNALETMECMLLLVTNDFSGSCWTNQEIGFALGKGVPLISLKVEDADPPGFVAHEQAVRGFLKGVEGSAVEVQRVVLGKLGRQERAQECLVAAFIEAGSYIEAMERFDRMSAVVKRLTEKQLANILAAFAGNNQISGSGYLNYSSRLVRFLEATTGKKFCYDSGRIKPKALVDELDDDIPF